MNDDGIARTIALRRESRARALAGDNAGSLDLAMEAARVYQGLDAAEREAVDRAYAGVCRDEPVGA